MKTSKSSASEQKGANRNHVKIRKHRRTIARDVTDRLCRFKGKEGVLFY